MTSLLCFLCFVSFLASLKLWCAFSKFLSLLVLPYCGLSWSESVCWRLSRFAAASYFLLFASLFSCRVNLYCVVHPNIWQKHKYFHFSFLYFLHLGQWTCSNGRGDKRRLRLPPVHELKLSINITRRKEPPSWGWEVWHAVSTMF